jgi:hypothetical protein
VRLIGVLVIVALGVSSYLVWPLWQGIETQSDPSWEVTTTLANQLTEVTKLLLGLATGTLGLLGFLFSDKVSTFWERSTPAQRTLTVLGAAFALSSIFTGLLTTWGVASLTADQNVRGGLPRVVTLQMIEIGELAAGFLLIAIVALLALTKDDHRSLPKA